jgi:ketosteroid isomerase-like protein
MAAMDLATVTGLVADDVVVGEPASLPYGGIFEGRDAFVGELLPAIVTDFDLEVGDVTVYAGGDRAAAQMDITFIAKRSGARVTMPYVEVYTVRDGLVTRIDVHPQDAGVLGDFLRCEGSADA